MKPGSLVVVKPLKVKEKVKPYVKWLPIADEETVYTIRKTGPDSAVLEEGRIGFFEGREIAINYMFLKEIQSPEERDSIFANALGGVTEFAS